MDIEPKLRVIDGGHHRFIGRFDGLFAVRPGDWGFVSETGLRCDRDMISNADFRHQLLKFRTVRSILVQPNNQRIRIAALIVHWNEE